MTTAAPPYPLPWPPLVRGILTRRRKRFLADILLDSGEEVTAHCANSGRMTECAEPGRPVWVSKSDNPHRKLAWTWELIEMPASLVGVNTRIPNLLVAGAADAGAIPELAGYETIRREVKQGKSRLDLLLESPDRRPCFVEVKNCTLVRDGLAAFPDAVTTRGQKHLAELADLARSGTRRCVSLYLIQRMDAKHFAPADSIDPAYGRAFRMARDAGVEMTAVDVDITLADIRVRRPVPVLNRF